MYQIKQLRLQNVSYSAKMTPSDRAIYGTWVTAKACRPLVCYIWAIFCVSCMKFAEKDMDRRLCFGEQAFEQKIYCILIKTKVFL